jgi:hypothetical protein
MAKQLRTLKVGKVTNYAAGDTKPLSEKDPKQINAPFGHYAATSFHLEEQREQPLEEVPV